MPDAEPYIRALEDKMRSRGLTQGDVAEETGISQGQLSRLLSGQTRIIRHATAHKLEEFVQDLNPVTVTVLLKRRADLLKRLAEIDLHIAEILDADGAA